MNKQILDAITDEYIEKYNKAYCEMVEVKEGPLCRLKLDELLNVKKQPKTSGLVLYVNGSINISNGSVLSVGQKTNPVELDDISHEEHVRVHAEASRGLCPDSLILSSDTYNKMLSTYSQVLKDAAVFGTGMVEATYGEGEVKFTHIPVREYYGIDMGYSFNAAGSLKYVSGSSESFKIDMPEAAHSEFKIGDEIIGNDFCNFNTLGKIIKIESHSIYKFVYTVVTSDKSTCVFYEDELKLAPTQLAPPIQIPQHQPPIPKFIQQFYGSTVKPEPLTVGCSHKNKRASYVMIAGRKEDFWVCVDCKEEVK